jgi:hypothetical protein
MNPDPSHHNAEKHARFAQWEKAAPISCAALAIAAVASAFAFRPSFLLVCGTFMGGLAIFFSWRAALAERYNATLAHALVGIVLALSGAVFAGHAPRPVLFAQAFPWVGFGLFFGILFIRRTSQNQ